MARTFHYLVSYDISEPKLLRQAAKLLEREGVRLQKSVFLVRCPQHRINRIRDRLADMLGHDHHLMILPLCKRCFSQGSFIGQAPEPCWVID